jgi:hypothetical protein
MRVVLGIAALVLLLPVACTRAQTDTPHTATQPEKTGTHAGFDRNEYPGDAALDELRRRFDFTGYWLNDPPGSRRNSWVGKREVLLQHGFGFLVLFNGRIDEVLVAKMKQQIAPDELGRRDAAEAIAAAQRERFPAGSILFLDQEEGGRLLPEAAKYLFAWTEAVAKSAYKPGAYLSGIESDDGNGPDGKPVTITTAADVQQQVASRHLAPVMLFVYQDSCPPSKGCTVLPPPLEASGTPGAAVWQYAQSPRRSAATTACAKTYAADGNCYATSVGTVFVDLDVAASGDPSRGR